MEAQLEIHSVIAVNESSHVGQVRRGIQALAKEMRVPAELGSRVALVGTELSTNLLKHSLEGGELLFRALEEEGTVTAIEIVAIDKGRGIPNISKAFNDGYSTAGSPGTGLGAISRMSDCMEIYSAPTHGTVISTQVRLRTSSAKFLPPRIRSICVPLEGFDVSGDYCLVIPNGKIFHILLSDGLGHGDPAAEASRLAADIFRLHLNRELPDILTRIHEGLHGTRGAALALARFDSVSRQLKYLALGNIDSRFCTEETCHGCVTLNGTAGVRLPKLTEFEYSVPPDAVLIMHTDGLSSRWNLQDYPGLSLHNPGAIAGLLYRDFARKRDDATLLVFAT